MDRIDLGYDLVALTIVGVPQRLSWVLGPGGLEVTEQVSELAKDRIDLGYDLVALTIVGVPQRLSCVLRSQPVNHPEPG